MPDFKWPTKIPPPGRETVATQILDAAGKQMRTGRVTFTLPLKMS